MFIYLVGSDVVKLPTTLTPDQSCSDKFMELVQPTEVGKIGRASCRERVYVLV